MKNLILFVLVFLVLASCSTDEGSNDALNEFKYEYEIIPIAYEKYVVERGCTANKVYGTLAYSYTIDTLEVKLNTGILCSIRIKANNYLDPNTSPPSNTPPHVNYLYFSDLRSNWDENEIKEIFFDENVTGGSYTTFTYSYCNIDLSQRPELFVLNPHIPTYTTLERKDEIIFTERNIYSNREYSIGEIIQYDGYNAEVLQKREI